MSKQTIIDGISIESRDADNYINATLMCKTAGKVFEEWVKKEEIQDILKLDQHTPFFVNEPLIKHTSDLNGDSIIWLQQDFAGQLSYWISQIFYIRFFRWLVNIGHERAEYKLKEENTKIEEEDEEENEEEKDTVKLPKEIPLIRDDGYVYATKMCRDTGTKIANWNARLTTKQFLTDLSKQLNIPIKELVEIKKGGNDKTAQGTWVHPIVATNIAQWISPLFSVKVSMWIEDWRKQKTENEAEYTQEINSLKPNTKIIKEYEIRDKLKELYQGEIEVKCNYGFVDVQTENMIIEVKYAKNWKHALGQVLVYAEEFPTKKLGICLFDIEDCSDIVPNITEIYKKYGVQLIKEPV